MFLFILFAFLFFSFPCDASYSENYPVSSNFVIDNVALSLSYSGAVQMPVSGFVAGPSGASITFNNTMASYTVSQINSPVYSYSNGVYSLLADHVYCIELAYSNPYSDASILPVGPYYCTSYSLNTSGSTSTYIMQNLATKAESGSYVGTLRGTISMTSTPHPRYSNCFYNFRFPILSSAFNSFSGSHHVLDSLTVEYPVGLVSDPYVSMIPGQFDLYFKFLPSYSFSGNFCNFSALVVSSQFLQPFSVSSTGTAVISYDDSTNTFYSSASRFFNDVSSALSGSSLDISGITNSTNSFNSAANQFATQFDTSHDIAQIQNSTLANPNLSIFASLISTGSLVKSVYSSFMIHIGDFAIPLRLMLTFVLASVIIGVVKHFAKGR